MLQSQLRVLKRRRNPAITGVRDVRQFVLSFNRRTTPPPLESPLRVAQTIYFYNGGIDR
jgi:hypothetical protein